MTRRKLQRSEFPSDPNRLPRRKRRRVRRLRGISVSSREPISEMLKAAEEGATHAVEFAEAVVRSTWVRRLAKWMGLCFLGFTLALVLIILGVGLFVRGDDVGALLKENIEEQLGGEFSYGHVDFNVLTGLKLEQIQYTPLGEIKPLLMADALSLRYRIWKLFLGTVNLKDLMIDHPRIRVISKNGLTNVDAILAYRAKHFPSLPDPRDKIDQPSPASMSIPIAGIFLPIGIDIERIGWRGLGVYLIDEDRETQRSMVGLDAHTGFSWRGFSSELSIAIGAAKKTGLTYEEQVAGRKRFVSAKFDFNGSLKNFLSLDTRLQGRLLQASMSSPSLQNLPFQMSFAASVDKMIREIRIQELSVNILDSIKYELVGEVGITDLQKQRFDLNLVQNMAIDFFALNPTLKQLSPSLEAFGHLALENLTIRGPLSMDEWSRGIFQIPFLTGAMRMVDIRLNAEEYGLAVKPINGHFAVGAGPSLVGDGAQSDVVMDINFDGMSIASEIDNKVHRLEIENMNAKLTGRGLFPKLSLPFLKFALSADHVRALSDEKQVVDVPFDLSLDTELRPNLNRAHIDLRLAMARLFELQFDGECRERCQQARVKTSVELDSIERLYQLSLPVLHKKLALNLLPKKITGRIGVKADLRGGIRKLNESNILEQLISDGETNYNMTADLDDLNIEMKDNSLSLKSFTNRMQLVGDMKKADFSFRQNFRDLNLDGSLAKLDKPVSLSQYDLDGRVEAFIRKGTDMKYPLAWIKALKVNLDTGFGQIDAPSILPRELANPKLTLSAKLDENHAVAIDDLALTIPDFGAVIHSRSDLLLNKELTPKSFSSVCRLQVDNGVGRVLPSGVVSSGGVDIKVNIESQQMRMLAVDGYVDFNHLSMKVPNANDIDRPLLDLSDMHGRLPFAQEVDLSGRESLPNPVDSNPSFAQVTEDFFRRSRDLIGEKSNKFVSVDYAGMRSYFPERTPITIGEIRAANLEVEDVELDFEVAQGWLALNNFSLKILGGKIQGSAQVAMDPEPVAINSSIHLTRLDTRKLIDGFPKLKKQSQGFSLLSDPYLDASTHVRYNLRENEIDGSLDITAIGKEQLRMILYYVDPELQNPTIAQMRTALAFGEVSNVSVPIRNGYVGLDVGVKVLSTPIPLPELRGFPIAQVIKNFKEQDDRSIEVSPQDLQGQDGDKSPPDDVENAEGGEHVPLVH